jgi:galactose oxidase
MWTSRTRAQRPAWAAVAWPVMLTVLFVFVVSPSFARANSTVGAWGTVQSLSYRPVHSTMLTTGKVWWWSSDNAQTWDPATGTVTTVAKVGYNLFCSGHSLVADGKILVTGGHISNNHGLADASYYNPSNNTWTRLPDMNAGRWYPTNVTLANGNVVVLSGDDENAARNKIPQVWQVGSNSWRTLSTASLSLSLYPAAFLAPNGKVFVATSTSRYLDHSGTGSWTTVATRKVSGRDNYGSACMYDNGKVIFTGGGDPPQSSCETINLNAGTPAWNFVAAMPQLRRQHNVTLLPDATVLVTGGSSANGFNTNDGPKPAINWNPANNTWTTWAMEAKYRGYHSEAVLLPDARVVSIGGDGQSSLQVFSPPYLFKGARPTISSAPASVGYGATFFVGTPNATGITKVNWIRLSSVTHTKNMNQRINKLTFTQASDGLNVTSPSSANNCPPGHYMLFILNGSGVPSVAKIIKIS